MKIIDYIASMQNQLWSKGVERFKLLLNFVDEATVAALILVWQLISLVISLIESLVVTLVESLVVVWLPVRLLLSVGSWLKSLIGLLPSLIRLLPIVITLLPLSVVLVFVFALVLVVLVVMMMLIESTFHSHISLIWHDLFTQV